MKDVHVLKLRPTQFAIGMREAEQKLKKLSRLRKNQLNKYVRKHPIKVVRSPQNEFYIVDHHHLLAVLWLLGVKKVPVRVTKTFATRKMSRPRFWKLLAARRMMHLYDQFGHGPHEPLYLPEDIRGLGDDPYRSLVWMVEQENGIRDTREPYAEFAWAQFFRKRKLLSPAGREHLDHTLKKALAVCRSRHARHLPGYRPPNDDAVQVASRPLASTVSVRLRSHR